MDYNINIPKGWVNLSIVNDLNYVKTGVEEYEGEKEYFSTGSIKGNIVIPEGKYEYKKRPSRANRIAKLGDVLQARMKKTDKAILVDENLDGKLFSTGFFQIRADENLIHNKYLFYYLKSFNFNKIKDELCSGSTQEALNDQGAKKIYIPVPPIKEQYRIVNKISELFSEIDKGLENLEIIRIQLNLYFNTVLKKAYDGEIFKSVIGNNIKPRYVRLSDVCEVVGGLTKNSKRDNYEKKYPYLRVANVYSGKLNLDEIKFIGVSESEIQKTLLKKGDLLFVEGNGSLDQIGRVAIWNDEIKDCLHQNHIIRVRPKENIISKYILYYFTSMIGRRKIEQQASSTSGLYTLSVKKVENLELPFIPIEKQINIIEEIENRLSLYDKLNELIQTIIQQADYLKQSILKKAFEGKLVPQDPKMNL